MWTWYHNTRLLLSTPMCLTVGYMYWVLSMSSHLWYFKFCFVCRDCNMRQQYSCLHVKAGSGAKKKCAVYKFNYLYGGKRTVMWYAHVWMCIFHVIFLFCYRHQPQTNLSQTTSSCHDQHLPIRLPIECSNSQAYQKVIFSHCPNA